MKRINLLSVATAVVLMVAAVGCTTMTGTQDEYYSSTPSNRVYVDDPYRGTVVLERDPYTGRYYEAGTYGSTYDRSGGYNSRYGNTRRYPNRSYNRGGGYSRGNAQPAPSAPRPAAEEQKKQYEQNRNEARKKVLGN